MKYPDVARFCLSLPDAYKEDIGSDAFSLKVGDNAFAYFETGAPVQWKFTLQVTPELFEELYNPPKIRKTDRPGGHWLMISRVENFENDDLLKDLIRWSYRQALEADVFQ